MNALRFLRFLLFFQNSDGLTRARLYLLSLSSRAVFTTSVDIVGQKSGIVGPELLTFSQKLMERHIGACPTDCLLVLLPP
ncbi:hypothetical protein [Phormidium sp. CCY1219]|uniref:hypothetical protein n=1 Tax=Phormidium sp. CCY1219 TaxID=2886104 RepID=UPI002D1F1889|nr:hypothetical protein [Phormidium sp. CCY1219]MEB3829190.1 hypothetical protein [Phormidium sp. CCY1219]